ncbi:MAG: hypothetical protein H0W70_11680, partial [Actinobacteria bacterium]|nr:hypothetical protein [Actinomycetota bacterium]
ADLTRVSGRQIFNLQSTKAGSVLLWITDPGQTNQLEVSEIAVRG